MGDEELGPDKPGIHLLRLSIPYHDYRWLLGGMWCGLVWHGLFRLVVWNHGTLGHYRHSTKAVYRQGLF